MKRNNRQATFHTKHQRTGASTGFGRAGLFQRQTLAALLLGSVFAPAPFVTVTALTVAAAIAAVAPSPAWADGGKGGSSVSGGAGGTGGISTPDNNGGAGGDSSLGGGDTGGGGGGGAGMGLGGSSTGGASGSGGVGGAHGLVTSSPIIFLGAIQGQVGGAGNDGTGMNGGGGGGAGGYGVVYNMASGTEVHGDFTGGAGGAGGRSDQGNAGSGGDGGHGLYVTSASVGINVQSHLTGGAGGAGGNSQSVLISAGGNGGAGGAGFVATSYAGVQPSNGGTITGGAGGAGGNSMGVGAQGGNGGAGGAGIRFDAGGAVHTGGTISGGNGGAKGLGNPIARDGAGGAGIIGASLQVYAHAGTVSGGLSGDGITRANAITFTGGSNLLALDDETNFIGNVVASSTNDMFELYGDTDHTFDASRFGVQFLGFGHFEMDGPNTWTLTGTSTIEQNWVITGGALAISSDDNLGLSTGTLTLNGGALRNTAAMTSTRAIVLGSGGTFQTDADLTLQGVITGGGGLNKTGTATLVLAGNNTYSGGTTVSAGTLSVSSEDNLGDVSGALTLNGGNLRVTGTSLTSLVRTVALGSNGGGFDIADPSATFTVAQTLLGSGGLAKQGAGTLVLSGANTYSGGTTINGGTLSASSDANLGDTSGALTLNGGVLRVNGTSLTSLARDVVLGSNGGGFEVTDPFGTFTLTQSLAGSGGLIKRGDGDMLLTGENTYTGGTVIESGGLYIGMLGTAGSIVGNVLNNGRLGFVRSDNVTFAGDISGSGSVSQEGGTLTLTGNNTYTGGTMIVAGSAVQVGVGGVTGSIVGDVGNEGTLAFKRSDAYTFGGVISGSGALRQLGAGVLSLTGDSSAYAGSTEVTAGTLTVDGKLGGSLTVNTGATLAGTGTAGATTIGAGGILSPGNAATPIGALAVNGDLTFAHGSAYHVDTDSAAGSTDKVHVTGTANLGGSVVHMGSDSKYAEATSYTILTADQGINGTFSSVSSNLAFLDPSLAYGAHDVNLVMQLKQVPGDSNGDGGTRPIRFADAALNGNQRAVANGLQSLPKSSDLYSRVLNLSNGAPPAVFKALSGESHASTVSTLQGVTDNVVSMPFDHLRANLDAGQLSGPPTAQLGAGDASALPRSAAKPVWAQVFGNWRTLGGDDGVSKVKESDGGLFVGADRGIGNGWRLGGALGYTGSHSSQKDLSSKADVDSYSATIYGGKALAAGPGKINLTAGTAYTWSDIRSKRNIGVMGLDQTLKSNYGASTGQVFTDLGYAVPLNDRVTLEPFVGAAYSDLRTRAFSESGGSAALNGKSNRNDVTTTTLGLRARTVFSLNETEGHLHGTVGWRHAFGDVNPETTLAFNGSQPFTVQGAPIARDAAVLELGADLAMNKNTTIGLSYNGQFGSSNKQNAGSINVNWRF